jgi:hypothetical protein
MQQQLKAKFKEAFETSYSNKVEDIQQNRDILCEKLSEGVTDVIFDWISGAKKTVESTTTVPHPHTSESTDECGIEF